MLKGIKAYDRRPPMPGGAAHVLMRSKLYLTCGNCQLLCWPEPADRKENFRILTSSGTIIQKPDGSLENVSPQQAEAYVSGLPEKERSLYTE